MQGESIIPRHQISKASAKRKWRFMKGKRGIFCILPMETYHAPAPKSDSSFGCFNPTCCSKRLLVYMGAAVIKMMDCSITILSSITLTSVLWTLWYFQGPKWPFTSHPSTLTPPGIVQITPGSRKSCNIMTSFLVTQKTTAHKYICTQCHLSVSTDFISSLC